MEVVPLLRTMPFSNIAIITAPSTTANAGDGAILCALQHYLGGLEQLLLQRQRHCVCQPAATFDQITQLQAIITATDTATASTASITEP
jgi:hypothetical protein